MYLMVGNFLQAQNLKVMLVSEKCSASITDRNHYLFILFRRKNNNKDLYNKEETINLESGY